MAPTTLHRTGQRSFDDLGTPLAEATFVVVDLETTGGSPIDDAITEVGAVKLRGGECQGTLQTLVNPGRDVPPHITVLTGITHAMTAPAPPIDEVLPALLEFIGDAVLVGHNLRFDTSFLDAALARSGRDGLTNRRVDTAALARRLVRDEVPNCRLGTLADRLRLDHRPSHRALDDALATGDLLHVLVERASSFGVFGLDDLLTLPAMAGNAQAPKLRLTRNLPRSPGVYRFRDAAGRVLYVGKATNLRARVRSYFSSDTRRKVHGLLRETQAIDVTECAHGLEAAVREIREIHQHLPRYNRQGTTWRRSCYLKLTDEPFPRFSIVTSVRSDGGAYLGPLGSKRLARRVAEAIETTVPIRRCTTDPRRADRPAPCAPAQLGVSTCPCSGDIDEAAYAEHARAARRAIEGDADAVLARLGAQMADLGAAERYEEAADVRDRGAALAGAIRRRERIDTLRRAGRVVLSVPGGGAELAGGRLVAAWDESGRRPLDLADDGCLDDDAEPDAPVGREVADEIVAVASWLDRSGRSVRIIDCDGPLWTPMRSSWSFSARR